MVGAAMDRPDQNRSTSGARRFPAFPVRGLTGASFKARYLDEILEDYDRVGFFEVHAENYMGAGGQPHAALERIRENFAISLHGVCMSIGGLRPLSRDHLSRFASLVERYEPAMVSEHLAWSTHDTVFYNDLLPLPYTDETLSRVCEHIDAVQSAIGRTLLLENPSTYVLFRDSTWSECEFLRAIVRRTGCGLLLDVNNVFVSAANHGFSAVDYIETFPLEHVGEIHLAGHAEQSDDEGAPLLIDSHDRPVADPVWALFEKVIAKRGPVPTLVEWDSNLPEWPILKREARAAQVILDRCVAQDPASTDPIEKIEMHKEASKGGTDYPAAFAQALLRPDREEPVCLSGPDGKGIKKRFNVYRNNVTVSLIDALADIYPATQRIVGEKFFREMARLHVRKSPPHSPLLFEYGRDFPEFIDRFEHTGGMPWLGDVARIERAWLDAYHAADAQPCQPDALAATDPAILGDLRFRAHPSARIVCSSFPAVTIFTANRADGAVETIESNRPEDALITRPNIDVAVRFLPLGGAAFLTALTAGKSLAEAASAGAEDAETFDLAANIGGMLEAGAFTEVVAPKPAELETKKELQFVDR
jgi:uncharacterized protein